MSEKITESVKKALELIKKKNLEGDVFGIDQRKIQYDIEKGEVSNSSEYQDFGLGIRVLLNSRVGFGYCVPGKEEKGVDRAVELSKLSPKTDISFPDNRDTPSVKTYDKKIYDVVMENEGAELTQMMIDGASEVGDDILPARGGLVISLVDQIIGNTNGLLLKDKGTFIKGGLNSNIDIGETSLTASQTEGSRRYEMNFKQIGMRSGKKVDSMRDSFGLPEGDIPVIISPDAVSQLMHFSLIPSFNGENVRKGKSFYEGRLSEKVAHDNFNLIDDPTSDWGIRSGEFDDEGVVSSELKLISDGTLENFMYDLKEASKSDTEGTANGMRSGFKSPPQITHRNLVVRGKENSVESLYPEKGIYVDGVMGAHTANSASGDFSVVANPVWLIEDKEKQGRIDGVMISGNFANLIESIELADDYKKTHLSLGGASLKMEIPTARLNDVTVSGK
ncbi:MAG: TldD/PmbA family protein [Thermoplasmata archaeon]